MALSTASAATLKRKRPYFDRSLWNVWFRPIADICDFGFVAKVSVPSSVVAFARLRLATYGLIVTLVPLTALAGLQFLFAPQTMCKRSAGKALSVFPRRA
jgi:hypothetical protein